MGVLKRRSRLVTFRTSPEEYENLVRSCIESGARSIAEFARASVLGRSQSARAGTLHGDLTTLGQALEELDAALVLARQRIRVVLGPAAEREKQQDEDGERPALRRGQEAGR